MKKSMSIPKKRVKISLVSQDPSKVTIESLKTQLHNLGLTCEHTNENNLVKYKEEVEARLPNGVNQAYGIERPKVAKDGEATYRSIYLNRDAPYIGLEEAAKGEWEPSGTGLGYMTELSTVIFPAHFDYLKEFKKNFVGQKSDEHSSKESLATVEAIKKMFVQVGTEASASLVDGLDKVSLNSVLSNAIAPINEGNVKDYNESDSRVIYLVNNYDPVTGEADAIGVLAIDWQLVIKDYQEKKQLVYDTELTISTRSILYDSIETLESDVKFVQSQLKDSLFSFIPPKGKLEIFDRLPQANYDTFLGGLPIVAKSDYTEVIILYAPNLQEVGSMDNADSTSTSTYSKTVESGFTFSMEQRISVGAEFEAGVVFAKGKVSVSLELSFTEQWNESQSETIEFTTPPNEKCYMYQGYLLSRKLRFYPEDDRYDYFSEEGRFVTDILKTSNTPINGSASVQLEKTS